MGFGTNEMPDIVREKLYEGMKAALMDLGTFIKKEGDEQSKYLWDRYSELRRYLDDHPLGTLGDPTAAKAPLSDDKPKAVQPPDAQTAPGKIDMEIVWKMLDTDQKAQTLCGGKSTGFAKLVELWNRERNDGRHIYKNNNKGTSGVNSWYSRKPFAESDGANGHKPKEALAT